MGNEKERERKKNIKTKKQSKLMLCANVRYFIASRSFVAGSHPIQLGAYMVLLLLLLVEDSCVRFFMDF